MSWTDEATEAWHRLWPRWRGALLLVGTLPALALIAVAVVATSARSGDVSIGRVPFGAALALPVAALVLASQSPVPRTREGALGLAAALFALVSVTLVAPQAVAAMLVVAVDPLPDFSRFLGILFGLLLAGAAWASLAALLRARVREARFVHAAFIAWALVSAVVPFLATALIGIIGEARGDMPWYAWNVAGLLDPITAAYGVTRSDPGAFGAEPGHPLTNFLVSPWPALLALALWIVVPLALARPAADRSEVSS